MHAIRGDISSGIDLDTATKQCESYAVTCVNLLEELRKMDATVVGEEAGGGSGAGVTEVVLSHLLELWSVRVVGAEETGKLLNYVLHPSILR